MELLGIKYVQLNLRYLCLYYPIKNLNVKIDDVIYGNDISTYDQARGGHGELKNIKYGNYHVLKNGNHCFYQKKNS